MCILCCSCHLCHCKCQCHSLSSAEYTLRSYYNVSCVMSCSVNLPCGLSNGLWCTTSVYRAKQTVSEYLSMAEGSVLADPAYVIAVAGNGLNYWVEDKTEAWLHSAQKSEWRTFACGPILHLPVEYMSLASFAPWLIAQSNTHWALG